MCGLSLNTYLLLVFTVFYGCFCNVDTTGHRVPIFYFIFKYMFYIFSSPGPWPMWAYVVALGRLACGVPCAVRCKLFSRDALALTIGF